MHQRGFDNQPAELMTAAEAAALLDVKRATLYAYVSRGWVKRVPAPGGRGSAYVRADVERLRARHDARAGHGPVAAAALRWGEPVLSSALTAIDARGPHYRGHAAVALAKGGTSFEAVAELLWSGALPQGAVRWPTSALPLPTPALTALVPPGAGGLAAVALVLPALAARDADRHGAAAEAERERARRLLPQLAAAVALGLAPQRRRPPRPEGGMADTVLVALGGPRSAEARRAVDAALVLLADHELNVSSFAARVAASSGADLYACLSAGLAAVSGPRHGASCDRVEALVDEVGRPERVGRAVQARTARGERPPGFGHRLYPGGDPRTAPLLALATALAPREVRVRTVVALVERMAARQEWATVDLGLVAVAYALGLPPGSATLLFALGRTAGWVAHVLEQREAGFLLRPRAHYTGPQLRP